MFASIKNFVARFRFPFVTVSRFEKTIEQLLSQMREHHDDICELQNRVQRLRDRIPELENEIERMADPITSTSEKQSELICQIEDLEKNLESRVARTMDNVLDNLDFEDMVRDAVDFDCMVTDEIDFSSLARDAMTDLLDDLKEKISQ